MAEAILCRRGTGAKLSKQASGNFSFKNPSGSSSTVTVTGDFGWDFEPTIIGFGLNDGYFTGGYYLTASAVLWGDGNFKRLGCSGNLTIMEIKRVGKEITVTFNMGLAGAFSHRIDWIAFA